MSFQAKTIGLMGGVLALALAFILFFRTSDQAAIEKLLREAAESAQKADAEAVVALISRSFESERGNYDWAAGRVRGALTRSPGFIEVLGCAVEVEDGERARALLHLRGYVGKNELWRMSLDLRLRKESGEWKVTSAVETAR